MPVIRISDSTWARLKKWAEPLEDTPEDVLSKVLDVAEGKVGARNTTNEKPILATPKVASYPVRRRFGSHLPRGMRTPNEAFRRPILESLKEFGGQGTMTDVLKSVKDRMKSSFKQADLQRISTGVVRWENTAQWEKRKLVTEGLVESPSVSGRGAWRLTRAGYDELAKIV